MARKRIKDDPGPFSLRLPSEMRTELEAIAFAQGKRSMHSLVLELLADGLAARRQAKSATLDVSSGAPSAPAR
jgi:hypothetical protein